MTGLVLIVDDVPTNIALIEAKLNQEFYDCITAENGMDALSMARTHMPDVILLDIMMPKVDGFEVCKALKADPVTMHIPVVMVTALSDDESRVKALQYGADDFLTKPVDTTSLLARVRSLIRLKRTADEWRTRQEMLSAYSQTIDPAEILSRMPKGGTVVSVDVGEDVEAVLETRFAKEDFNLIHAEFQNGEIDVELGENHDVLLVDFTDQFKEKLRFCSSLNTFDTTRHTPVLVIMQDAHAKMVPQVLEVGVTDYILKPFSVDELEARIRSNIRRKSYQKALKDNYQQSLTLALTDDLTGLYNRRYVDAHMQKLFGRGKSSSQRPISLMMMDIDHFKSINDTYGHAAGDSVLREVSARIQRGVRNVDLAGRMGGEEFIIIMPDTSHETAMNTAERLKESIGTSPFFLPEDGLAVTITVSIGVATGTAQDDVPEKLIEAADKALYAAKDAGRNCVIAA